MLMTSCRVGIEGVRSSHSYNSPGWEKALETENRFILLCSTSKSVGTTEQDRPAEPSVGRQASEESPLPAPLQGSRCRLALLTKRLCCIPITLQRVHVRCLGGLALKCVSAICSQVPWSCAALN